ncbi:MAG TPA: hypothetical protein VGF80_02085 [Galbitalea sp.]
MPGAPQGIPPEFLASLRRRARTAHAPGSLVSSALRWSGFDRWTQSWWPQGIAVGAADGIPVVLVSWYSRRENRGARVSVLRLDTLRYAHVALVEGPNVDPVRVHAGGILWPGGRLLVADTHGGIREFELAGIARRGGRWVLPQTGMLARSEKFRYSFLGESPDEIVAGEFARDESGRLARLTLSDGAVSTLDIHSPGIPEMQGAVLVEGSWAISSSRGDRLGGDLWVGARGSLEKHEAALPPGPEDLAWWPERRQIWGATEHPGQRWVYAVDWPPAEK